MYYSLLNVAKTPLSTQLHATCVSIDGKAVLLLGKSGSGKSDLALRLIYDGAKLVADDRVDIKKSSKKLLASAPAPLRGLLEVRGVGILKFPCLSNTPLALAINLIPRKDVERLPQPQFFDCLGLQLPLLSLQAFDHSTPAKIIAYLVRL